MNVAMFHRFPVSSLNTHSPSIWNFEFQISNKINVTTTLIFCQRHQKCLSPPQDFHTRKKKKKMLSYFKPSYMENSLEFKINGSCLINQLFTLTTHSQFHR